MGLQCFVEPAQENQVTSTLVGDLRVSYFLFAYFGPGSRVLTGAGGSCGSSGFLRGSSLPGTSCQKSVALDQLW